MKQITFGEYKNVIGKVLARIRTERGLSQSELAAKMQVLGVKLNEIKDKLQIMNLLVLVCA